MAVISGFIKMSKWDLPCLSAYHTHSSQVPTYIHKGNSSFNICILYTCWSYTKRKRSQDWSKHTVKNCNTTVANCLSHCTFLNFCIRGDPEYSFSTHINWVYQNSIPFRRGKSLGYLTPQWTQVTGRAHSHHKGWSEHMSSAGLINWAHTVKLQSYSNTDCKKAGLCNIQKWNIGHPPTVLQTTAAADSPMHIPDIPCTYRNVKPCQ